MKIFPQDLIRNALDDTGIDPDEGVYSGYSGRGMFGASCDGVKLDGTRELLEFGARLMNHAWVIRESEGADYDDLVIELLEVARTDSLGRGTIVYFPGWQFGHVED